MRLNRYLALASGLSRRSADDAIKAGRVQINGENPDIGYIVSPHDVVTLDGRELTPPPEYTYIIYHKPVGLVCSRRGQGNSRTIYDELPAEFINLRSVGRLDRDSSGLLVLTDDGEFAHRQTHPSFEKVKRYTVELSSPLQQEDRAQLIEGIDLDDGPSRLHVESVDNKKSVVTLTEGRNRQIRRSFAALGYEVVTLHRTNFGPLILGDLEPGAWRTFIPAEYKF